MGAGVVFAVALLNCYSGPLARWDTTLAVVDAIRVTLAAVLVAIAVMFELAGHLRKLVAAPLSLSILMGLAAILPATAILKLHALAPAAVLLLLSLRMLMLVARDGNWRRAVAPLLGGAAIGYWTFLLSYVDGYKMPWEDVSTMLGQVHVDLLFHSGIVNMLRYYGIGSTGVDGTIPFPYYFGSHRVAEAFSSILDIQPLTFYSAIFPLLLGPLFVAMFYFFAVSMHGYILNRDTSDHQVPGTRGSLFWLLIAIVFIGVLPLRFRRDLGLFDNVFHSESFGMGVLLAYLPGVFLFECMARRSPLRSWVVCMIVGSVFLGALCMVKLSVACVVAATAGYLLLRLSRSWLQRACGMLALAAPLAYGLWSTRGTPSGDSGPGIVDMIKPFAFLRDVIEPRLWPLSFIAFFGPIILFLLVRVIPLRARSPVTLRVRFNTFQLLDVEFAIVMVIVSVIPSLILSIPQASANFFSEVSYWFVLPMLAVILFERITSLSKSGKVACGRPAAYGAPYSSDESGHHLSELKRN